MVNNSKPKQATEKKKRATEKRNIFISKQKMSQSSVIEALKKEPVSPEETQGTKTQDLAQVTMVHVKGMISVSPDSYNLPIHRKVLNSLTWDIWFSLINSNLLMF